MKKSCLTSVVSGLALLAAIPASASDMEHKVVAKVIEAYGGKKFENLKSIKISNDLRYAWLGQGQTPNMVELEPMRKIYEIDLINQLGSEEAWGGYGSYAEEVIFDGEKQLTVNYNDKTYSEDTEADFYGHFGGEIRVSDTLLAYELMKQRNKASLKGEQTYNGTPHYVLEFDMPGTSVDPQLWIDKNTGLISKMMRDIPDTYLLTYLFGDHKKSSGISYSDDFSLYVDDTIVEYAKSHKIEINRVKPSAFRVEKGISPEAESVDTSAMSIDEIAPGLYHVGEGYRYNAFLDGGDHWIGIGGYGGLKDRFDAFVEDKGTKPLRYVLLNHHHLDHVEGAKDALDLGAILVMPETAVNNATKVAGAPIPDNKMQILMSDTTSVGGVDIHMIKTSHVQTYALPYVQRAKTVFQGDLYGNNLKSRAGTVNHAGMSMKSEIERLGLEVDTLLSAHHRKAEKWSDFEAMAAKHIAGTCPTGRKICQSFTR